MRKPLLRWTKESSSFCSRKVSSERALLSVFVGNRTKIPSLTVSKGKKHNDKPVPYVTGRISEAEAGSLSASVPFVQLHMEKNICKLSFLH